MVSGGKTLRLLHVGGKKRKKQKYKAIRIKIVSEEKKSCDRTMLEGKVKKR